MKECGTCDGMVEEMCEPEPRVVPVGAVVAVLAGAVAAGVVVAWLTANWVLVLATVIVTAAVGAVAWRQVCRLSVWLSRLSVSRSSSWAACRECGAGPWAHRVAHGERVCLWPLPVAWPEVQPRALPAPPLAIEAAPLRVAEGVIIKPSERISR